MRTWCTVTRTPSRTGSGRRSRSGALLVGWLVTLVWGDPVDLAGGGFRSAGRWAVLRWLERLVAPVVRQAPTGLLPGQATHAMIEEGPFRISRNPLYVGLLALYLGLGCWHPRAGGSCCSRQRCCSSCGARSFPRSGFCTSGSEPRTTITRGGCVVGCDAIPPKSSPLTAALVRYQSIRWAKDTMIPSGPRTYAMRQMSSY